MKSLIVLAAALLAGAAPAAQEGDAPNCRATLKGANVWTGDGFARRDLSFADGRFTAAPAAGAPTIDASFLWLAPPFVDAHTHTIDTPSGASDKAHDAALRRGIFYAINPNNIRPAGATPRAGPTQVDLQAAGGGVTGPGGHPRPLYEFLAGRGFLGPQVTVASLPGAAFHEATTPDEARAAVRRVKANGASMVKLYLLNHDTPRSNGLSAEAFEAAADEARRSKLRAIVHIESAADFRRAVAAGVAGLAHSPYAAASEALPEANYRLTPADAAAAKRAGVVVVATLTPPFTRYDGARLAGVQATQRHNLTLLRDAGVDLALGADNYASDLHDELSLLRTFSLFEGPAVLRMATANGARLGWGARRIGALDAGFEASLLGWFQNPIGEWPNLDRPVLGLREGRLMIDQVGLFKAACPGGAALP